MLPAWLCRIGSRGKAHDSQESVSAQRDGTGPHSHSTSQAGISALGSEERCSDCDDPRHVTSTDEAPLQCLAPEHDEDVMELMLRSAPVSGAALSPDASPNIMLMHSARIASSLCPANNPSTNLGSNAAAPQADAAPAAVEALAAAAAAAVSVQPSSRSWAAFPGDRSSLLLSDQAPSNDALVLRTSTCDPRFALLSVGRETTQPLTSDPPTSSITVDGDSSSSSGDATMTSHDSPLSGTALTAFSLDVTAPPAASPPCTTARQRTSPPPSSASVLGSMLPSRPLTSRALARALARAPDGISSSSAAAAAALLTVRLQQPVFVPAVSAAAATAAYTGPLAALGVHSAAEGATAAAVSSGLLRLRRHLRPPSRCAVIHRAARTPALRSMHQALVAAMVDGPQQSHQGCRVVCPYCLKSLWPEPLVVPEFMDELEDAPDAFRCPITLHLMREPTLAPSGKTYDKAAILKWLDRNSADPITRAPLQRKALVPNMKLRETMTMWLDVTVPHVLRQRRANRPVDPFRVEELILPVGA